MKKQCAADSKRSGKRCKRRPSIGKTVCATHGGKSLSGKESPRFKHGKYSKYLPDKLAERLEDLNQDRQNGELMSLEEQIKVVLVRISQLNERLLDGDSEQTWKDLEIAFNDIKNAVKNQDTNTLSISMVELQKIIKTGRKEYRAWEALFKAQKHLDTLATNQTRRMLMAGHAIMIDQVVLMFSIIVDTINRVVKDEATLRELRQELYNKGVEFGIV